MKQIIKSCNDINIDKWTRELLYFGILEREVTQMNGLVLTALWGRHSINNDCKLGAFMICLHDINDCSIDHIEYPKMWVQWNV